jgi:hypothetical protein
MASQTTGALKAQPKAEGNFGLSTSMSALAETEIARISGPRFA